MKAKTCCEGVLTLLVLAGCTGVHPHAVPELTLAHQIDVPEMWREGAEFPGNAEWSTIARYVSAYDRAWWIAVERYRANIDFNDPSPLLMPGWPEEAAGGATGYAQARDRIKELIQVHGKQKVSVYLQQFKLAGGD